MTRTGESLHSETGLIRGSENLGAFMPVGDPAVLAADVSKALAASQALLLSEDHEFTSRRFILDKFLQFGIPVHPAAIFAPWQDWMNRSGFGSLQFPTEFVDFLRTLIPLDIATGIEVGTYRGGSGYFMCSVLQRANPAFRLEVLDIEDNLIAFEIFSDFLNVEKLITTGSDAVIDRDYDFVFIDGDHSYDGVMADFENVGQRARKAVAFHDIHAHEFDTLNGGTVRAWNEVKSTLRRNYAIYEFAHSAERSLGIGLAVRCA
ncbi:Methyltransferase domain-containing protein [Roseovarius azorensis]|uniref:Methyltransferase domain-containing protein n=1 Tax=Roseovarius azorensis TaxID=1287727 RepID=A0A1H7QH93_9RHOB|nr:class I SAM-dependent methyltransferase [Roseovarius azorensis]SEL47332.1 Methyltransferase domain-containing protein [Roseovarius azorensis]